MAFKSEVFVGLSVSDGPDSLKLGFPRSEVKRAFFTLCTALIRSGAKVMYGGDLRTDGWTLSMVEHLGAAYAGEGNKPFIPVLSELVLRANTFERICSFLKQSRAIATIQACLGSAIYPITLANNSILVGAVGSTRLRISNQDEFASWLNSVGQTNTANSLTFMRQSMTQMAHVRISLGGKMGLVGNIEDQYLGVKPGVVEEAFMSVQAKKLYIPLGAYGGATRDIAIALDLLPSADRVPRGEQAAGYEAAIRSIEIHKENIPHDSIDALRAICQEDRGEVIAQQVIEFVTSKL